MSVNQSKLMAAISVAVTTFIKLEEEARASVLTTTPRGISNLWGVSARQDTMQLRRLYQLRLSKR